MLLNHNISSKSKLVWWSLTENQRKKSEASINVQSRIVTTFSKEQTSKAKNKNERWNIAICKCSAFCSTKLKLEPVKPVFEHCASYFSVRTSCSKYNANAFCSPWTFVVLLLFVWDYPFDRRSHLLALWWFSHVLAFDFDYYDNVETDFCTLTNRYFLFNRIFFIESWSRAIK